MSRPGSKATRDGHRAAGGVQEEIADAITRLAGSTAFVYAHLPIYGTWIGQLGLDPYRALRRWRPSGASQAFW